MKFILFLFFLIIALSAKAEIKHMSLRSGALCLASDKKVSCNTLKSSVWHYANAIRLDGFEKIQKMDYGYGDLCVLEEGNVLCSQKNTEDTNVFGQLENPRLFSTTGYTACALDDEGLKCAYGSSLSNILLAGFQGIKKTYLGLQETCLVDEIGKLRCSKRAVPEGIYNPDFVSMGYGHVCSAKNDIVKCWGDIVTEDQPQDFKNIRQIVSGFRFTCVLDDFGGRCFGARSAQIQDVDQLVGSKDKFCALKDGKPVSCTGLLFPSEISNFSSLQLGNAFSCTVIETKEVKCWSNSTGALIKLPDVFSRMDKISVGISHMCGVFRGKVSCWGANTMGESNPPQDLSESDDVYTTEGYSCSMKDGRFNQCWGRNRFIPKPLKAIKKIKIDNYNRCALDADKGLHCWEIKLQGSENVDFNQYGRVIDFDLNSYSICVVTEERVKCWGQLQKFSKTFLQLGIKELKKLAIGSDHLCGTTNQGVKCWGSNTSGQLLVPQSFEGLDVDLQSWGNMSCVLFEGKVDCWGENFQSLFVDNYEEGYKIQKLKIAEDENNHSEFNVCYLTDSKIRCPFMQVYPPEWEVGGFEDIMLTVEAVCGLKAGKIQCWFNPDRDNSNSWRLWGYSDLEDVNKIWGDEDLLCARTSQNTICLKQGLWTVNPYLEKVAWSNHAQAGCQLEKENFSCWANENSKNQTLIEVPFVIKNLIDFGVGNTHACALHSIDQVTCWGDLKGLNVPFPVDLGPVSLLSTGPHYSCAMDDKSLKCWGRNYREPLNPPSVDVSKVRAMETSTETACVYGDLGVQCWGAKASIVMDHFAPNDL